MQRGCRAQPVASPADSFTHYSLSPLLEQRQRAARGDARSRDVDAVCSQLHHSEGVAVIRRLHHALHAPKVRGSVHTEAPRMIVPIQHRHARVASGENLRHLIVMNCSRVSEIDRMHLCCDHELLEL